MSQSRRKTMSIGNIGVTPVSVTQSLGLDQTGPSKEIGKMITKSGTTSLVSLKDTATSSGLDMLKSHSSRLNGLSLGERTISQQIQATSSAISQDSHPYSR